MEEQYNWNLILIVSIPIALIEAYIFYKNLSNAWKWSFLAVGLLLAGGIVYMKDKKKSNVFTAAAIVFLAALLIRTLRDFKFI